MLALLFCVIGKNHAKTVLPYLRGKLRKSEPFNRMKLMVVGLQVFMLLLFSCIQLHPFIIYF